jgi:hypothetical protein
MNSFDLRLDIRDANNILDRLGGLADTPNRDPKKIVDATKALNKKLDPIIKTVKTGEGGT